MRSSSRFSSLFEHDLFGKPLHTFPDHAPSKPCMRRAAMRAAVVLRQDLLASGRLRRDNLANQLIKNFRGNPPCSTTPRPTPPQKPPARSPDSASSSSPAS